MYCKEGTPQRYASICYRGECTRLSHTLDLALPVPQQGEGLISGARQRIPEGRHKCANRGAVVESMGRYEVTPQPVLSTHHVTMACPRPRELAYFTPT